MDKANMVRHAHGLGHGHDHRQYTLHLHNTNFSYLTLLLQQHSLPYSGVNNVIVLIHL